MSWLPELVVYVCRFSAEPDDRPPRGRGRGDRGLNRRWGSERNTHNAGLFFRLSNKSSH